MRLSPMQRVCSVILTLLGLSALLLPQVARLPGSPGERHVPWYLLTVLFALVEVCVLHVQVRREAQTVSLCELPLVLGLFFTDPRGLLLARLVGPALVFIFYRKQPAVKVVYNMALLTANAATALVVFDAVLGLPPSSTAAAWVATYAAVGLSGVLDALATTCVIGALEGRVSPRDLWREPLDGALRGSLVATFAIVAVQALAHDVAAALPLAAILAIVLGAYRAYAALSERHLSLERLYQFSQVISSSPEVEAVLRSVLDQARQLLHATSAEIIFLSHGSARAVRVVLPPSGRLQRYEVQEPTSTDWMWQRMVQAPQALLLPRGGKDPAVAGYLEQLGYREAAVAPLRGESGVIGVLLVGDRLGDIRSFDTGDARLLQTVANHAGVALQNGRLIDQLRHDALHDALTGLPNRVRLQQEIQAELGRLTAGSGSGFAVVLMDLNGFKAVNDTLGHQHGDELLREVGHRLLAAADGALVVRLGGDEFAFVLPGVVDVGAATAFTQRILFALEQPISLDGVDVEVSAAIGVALAPAPGVDGAVLLKRADLAMYDAKARSAGVRVYDESLDTMDPQRLALAGELRQAIESGQLEVHVQPKVRLDTDQVTGVEALVRWDHPVLGPVPPDEFVPVAERSGLIRPLTMLVLSRALEACAGWLAEGLSLSVAVNLSARSLTDVKLVEDVARLLRHHAVPAHLLTLEITESSVMTDPTRAMNLLVALQEMGVRLSVDDFGTGYSSLSYLKRLPVHEVKIDRSFITDLMTDADDDMIARSIIDLAANLSLEVVAEGVEDRAAVDRLRELGCAYAQGYHLARPMPTGDLVRWLRARQGTPSVPLPRAPRPRTAGLV